MPTPTSPPRGNAGARAEGLGLTALGPRWLSPLPCITLYAEQELKLWTMMY